MMKVDKRLYVLIAGACISKFACTLSWSVMHKTLYESVSPRFIAFEQMLVAISVMVISGIWNKIQTWMVKNYVKLEIWETLFTLLFYSYFLFRWNPYLYYFADVAYYILIGSFLYKTATTCYTKLFRKNQDRIDADSALDFFVSISSIIGFGAAVFIVPSLKCCIILFMLADVISTITKIYTYQPKNLLED